MSTTNAFSSEPSLFDQTSDEPAAEPAPIPVAQEPAQERVERPSTPDDRKKLAEQLGALKRKEFELRRALAAAEHPELAESIRLLEGRAFSVSRAEAKLAQGLSKSEARRREVIEKKLGSLRDKRSELDTQIGALEAELGELGADRLTTFGQEREQALEQLLIALGTHEVALRAAGLDPSHLVPEIAGWLPELEALARKVSGASS
jgi:chromosome segregation ATPase